MEIWATAFTGTHSARFPSVMLHEKRADEDKVDSRDEPLQQIFVAERCVKDAADPHKVTISVVEGVRIRIAADG
jgi:hypothetical protein